MKNKSGTSLGLANLVIGLVVSFLPGLYFIVQGLFDSYLALSSPGWETTQSVSFYVLDNEGGRKFSYQYMANDFRHESHRFSFAYPFSDERAILDPYQDGQVVDVYYSPHFPAQATLQTGWGWGPLVFIGLGIMLLGIGTVAFRWGTGRIKISSIDPINWA